jgi:hypothetical protein
MSMSPQFPTYRVELPNLVDQTRVTVSSTTEVLKFLQEKSILKVETKLGRSFSNF